MIVQARTTVLLMAILVGSCSNASAYDSLEEVLQEGSKHEIHGFFNEIRQSTIKEDGIAFLVDIYRRPQEYTSERNSDLVKIHALSDLMQAKRNGWKIAEDLVNDGFEFSLEHVGSENDYIARTAIRVLSIYDRPKGFDKLLKLTAKEDPRLYRAGVLGLVSMCNSFDPDKFGKLLDRVSSDNRRIAKKIKEDFFEFSSSSSWCNG